VHDRLVSLDGEIDFDPAVACPFAYQDYVSVPRKHNRVVVIGPNHDFAFKTAKMESLSTKSFEMRTGVAIVFSYFLNDMVN
jgi:predicted class III extradiol MEMO1 family dioxygenase